MINRASSISFAHARRDRTAGAARRGGEGRGERRGSVLGGGRRVGREIYVRERLSPRGANREGGLPLTDARTSARVSRRNGGLRRPPKPRDIKIRFASEQSRRTLAQLDDSPENSNSRDLPRDSASRMRRTCATFPLNNAGYVRLRDKNRRVRSLCTWGIVYIAYRNEIVWIYNKIARGFAPVSSLATIIVPGSSDFLSSINFHRRAATKGT